MESKREAQGDRRAVRRLYRDLKQLQRENLKGVAAAPLDTDMFTWHANIATDDGPYAGVMLHIVLTFPKDYPLSPPSVELMTHLRHPNVYGNFICLDLLKPYTTAVPYQGWSSAYSVSSILLQLQSFLFAINVPQEYGGTRVNSVTVTNVSDARAIASAFKCSGCKHSGKNPWPRIKTGYAPPDHVRSKRSLRRERKRLARQQALEDAAPEPDSPTACHTRWVLDEYTTHYLFSFLAYEDLKSLSSAWVFFQRVLDKFQVMTRMELLCFHRQCTFEEDVLGLGLQVTRHQTGGVKTLVPTLDMLSLSAFEEDHLRLSVWKEPFEAFLPLIINTGHGQRAFPHIEATFARLRGASSFTPQMALDYIVKLMNSMVVGLMKDYGTGISSHASENALSGYCAFHHMLLAFAERYPIIQSTVERRVQMFMDQPNKRNKTSVPDLGEFIVYLALSTVTWSQIATPLLKELFDRNIRWMLRDNPEMATGVGNCYRLRTHFEKSVTGIRLFMFQFFFLKTAAQRPLVSPSECLRSYNASLGQPRHGLARRLQDACRRILRIDDWPDFFDFIEVPQLTSTTLAKYLSDAVQNSKRKGYHRPPYRRRRYRSVPDCLCKQPVCRYAVWDRALRNAQLRAQEAKERKEQKEREEERKKQSKQKTQAEVADNIHTTAVTAEKSLPDSALCKPLDALDDLPDDLPNGPPEPEKSDSARDAFTAPVRRLNPLAQEFVPRKEPPTPTTPRQMYTQAAVLPVPLQPYVTGTNTVPAVMPRRASRPLMPITTPQPTMYAVHTHMHHVQPYNTGAYLSPRYPPASPYMHPQHQHLQHQHQHLQHQQLQLHQHPQQQQQQHSPQYFHPAQLPRLVAQPAAPVALVAAGAPSTNVSSSQSSPRSARSAQSATDVHEASSASEPPTPEQLGKSVQYPVSSGSPRLSTGAPSSSALPLLVLAGRSGQEEVLHRDLLLALKEMFQRFATARCALGQLPHTKRAARKYRQRMQEEIKVMEVDDLERFLRACRRSGDVRKQAEDFLACRGTDLAAAAASADRANASSSDAAGDADSDKPTVAPLTPRKVVTRTGFLEEFIVLSSSNPSQVYADLAAHGYNERFQPPWQRVSMESSSKPSAGKERSLLQRSRGTSWAAAASVAAHSRSAPSSAANVSASSAGTASQWRPKGARRWATSSRPVSYRQSARKLEPKPRKPKRAKPVDTGDGWFRV